MIHSYYPLTVIRIASYMHAVSLSLYSILNKECQAVAILYSKITSYDCLVLNVLQESLGGNTLTVMLAMVSPAGV